VPVNVGILEREGAKKASQDEEEGDKRTIGGLTAQVEWPPAASAVVTRTGRGSFGFSSSAAGLTVDIVSLRPREQERLTSRGRSSRPADTRRPTRLRHHPLFHYRIKRAVSPAISIIK